MQRRGRGGSINRGIWCVSNMLVSADATVPDAGY